MRWKVHGRRTVYDSDWIRVHLNDVELPDGKRIEHHVLEMPRRSVTAVVVDGDRTLMLWRHRFITDAWGWEIPAGWTEPGEDPQTAIRREIEEETGWRAHSMEPMVGYNALSGLSTMHFTAYLATDVEQIGEPEGTESTRIEWIPLVDVPKLVENGHLLDGPSLTALSYYLGIHNTQR